ncbi:MAG: hypothetical protein QG552_2080 [Thermodesulfobacteriota bacterium]|nr:hypothetical protein [Thermodesulfobacteriota bacterium]
MGKIRRQTASVPRGLIRAVVVLIFMFLPLLVTSCSDSDSTTKTPSPPGGETLSFLKAHYRTSHNSYSGNLDNGYRGSIIQQLDAGLRFVELDIHCEIDGDNVSFIVGHSDPKQYVDRTHGNPDSYDAEDWVNVVTKWVHDNQPREPVILAFDWKKDKDNDTPKALEALHNFFAHTEEPSEMDAVCYPKDFDADTILDYPGKILVVLSGNEDVRQYYSDNYCFTNSQCSDKNAHPVAHMFVEYQAGNTKVSDGEFFYARAADDKGSCDWAQGVEDEHFTRLWLVTNDSCKWDETETTWKGPNLPATNFPYFGWYARYTHGLEAIPIFEFGDVDWKSPHSPGKGSNPDVAVNNLGHVVEVHKSQNSDHLYYSIGNISEDGHSIKWDTENQNYTDDRIHGTTPSVAIVDHLNAYDQLLLIEIHVDDVDDPKLYYRFGLIGTDGGKLTGKITWQGENWTHYDDGNHPSVAINEDKMVVEVHEGSKDYKDLWYNVGGFDGEEFSWGWNWVARKYNTGVRPTVALHGNLIFEAHYDLGNPSPSDFTAPCLFSQIGLLNASAKYIEWKWENPDPDKTNEPTYPFPIDESGSLYPSVALYSKGAVEAHMSSGGGIWWRMGKTSNSVMAVGPTKDIQDTYSDVSASGTKISIAASDTHVVLAFINDNNIYYMVGLLK